MSSSILPRPSRLTRTLFEYGGPRDHKIKGHDIKPRLRTRYLAVCALRVYLHADGILVSTDASGTQPKTDTRQTGSRRGVHHDHHDNAGRDAATARFASGILLMLRGSDPLSLFPKEGSDQVPVVHDIAEFNYHTQLRLEPSSIRSPRIRAPRHRAAGIPWNQMMRNRTGGAWQYIIVSPAPSCLGFCLRFPLLLPLLSPPTGPNEHWTTPRLLDERPKHRYTPGVLRSASIHVTDSTT